MRVYISVHVETVIDSNAVRVSTSNKNGALRIIKCSINKQLLSLFAAMVTPEYDPMVQAAIDEGVTIVQTAGRGTARKIHGLRVYDVANYAIEAGSLPAWDRLDSCVYSLNWNYSHNSLYFDFCPKSLCSLRVYTVANSSIQFPF